MAAAGEPGGVREACRRHNTSPTMYYRRKAEREKRPLRPSSKAKRPAKGGARPLKADVTAPGWGLVSPEQAERLLAALQLPLTWAGAAAHAGIPPYTFADWRRKGREALRAGDITSPYACILLECEAARTVGRFEVLVAVKEQAVNGNVAAQGILVKAYTSLDETDADVDASASPAKRWLDDVQRQIAEDDTPPPPPVG